MTEQMHVHETRVMDMALNLMEKVDDRLSRMEDKLDALSAERRDEAKEHGGLLERVNAIEESHKSAKVLLNGVATAVVIGILLAIFYLILAAPRLFLPNQPSTTTTTTTRSQP